VATAIAILSLMVAVASALAGLRSASHARASVAEAKRSADAAVASAREARRTADAEEAALALERERLAQERRAWDAQDAPQWAAPNIMYNDGERLRMTLTNTGPDARITAVVLTHPLGQCIGTLQHSSEEAEHDTLEVGTNESLSVFFAEPRWRELATGGHSAEAEVSAMSTMRGVRSILAVSLLARGIQHHDNRALWKPGTWRSLS
jgi:hypothetical protein